MLLQDQINNMSNLTYVCILMPLVDGLVCYCVSTIITSWLLFNDLSIFYYYSTTLPFLANILNSFHGINDRDVNEVNQSSSSSLQGATSVKAKTSTTL